MSYGFLYPEGVLDMAIKINTEKRIFTLETKHTMYQMQADTYGVLRHLWYGAKTGCDMSYLQDYPDVGFSGNPHDAGAGIGDFRVPAVEAVHADGSCALDLRYYSYTVKQGKYAIAGLPALYAGEDEAETLEVVLRDTASAVEVTLKYGVLPELDVVTRCAEIRNLGEAPVTLTKAASLCLDMGQGSWEWIHFYGRHAMEREMERNYLGHGNWSVGSIRSTAFRRVPAPAVRPAITRIPPCCSAHRTARKPPVPAWGRLWSTAAATRPRSSATSWGRCV